MEKVAATIPHLFYDLLARVIPGCILLTAVAVQEFEAPLFGGRLPRGESNFAQTLLAGIAFVAASYLVGWILSSFSLSRLLARSGKGEKGQKYRAAYYAIKLKDENTGFRILKLRAEVRMLEAVQVAVVVLLLLNLGRVITPEFFGTGGDATRLIAVPVAFLLLLLLGTQLAIPDAWKRYHGAIETCMALLDAKPEESDPDEKAQTDPD